MELENVKARPPKMYPEAGKCQRFERQTQVIKWEPKYRWIREAHLSQSSQYYDRMYFLQAALILAILQQFCKWTLSLLSWSGCVLISPVNMSLFASELPVTLVPVKSDTILCLYRHCTHVIYTHTQTQTQSHIHMDMSALMNTQLKVNKSLQVKNRWLCASINILIYYLYTFHKVVLNIVNIQNTTYILNKINLMKKTQPRCVLIIIWILNKHFIACHLIKSYKYIAWWKYS